MGSYFFYKKMKEFYIITFWKETNIKILVLKQEIVCKFGSIDSVKCKCLIMIDYFYKKHYIWMFIINFSLIIIKKTLILTKETLI